MSRLCRIEGCDRTVHANGLCTSHESRIRRTGRINRTRLTTDELQHEIAHFTHFGYSHAQIAQRLGIKPTSLQRALQRAES